MNAAENVSSGRTDGWSPETSELVGAVIGSIAEKSAPAGEYTWAYG